MIIHEILMNSYHYSHADIKGTNNHDSNSNNNSNTKHFVTEIETILLLKTG